MNAARLHCRLEDIARRLPHSPIILTTTMWDDLPDDARDGANARELGLKTLFETNLVVPAQSKPYPVAIKRLPSSDTHHALVALFDLIESANYQRRGLVEADLASLEGTEGVEKLRSLLQDQFRALDKIRTNIKEGGKGYMSLDDLRSKYIACKMQAKGQVDFLQRSKVSISHNIARVVQPNTNFGVWSKTLNSRLSRED
ncbi:hypothetical protein BJ165DRAFT_1531172 [Panaeolus papilionaceus]|nr:hypothetical protein BJ165DRAFT_1531172 [Panaeolus papilionaceus]